MPFDVCIETYGSVAPFIGTDTVSAVFGSRAHLSRRRRAADQTRTETDLTEAVAVAADRLPFLLLQALWLIDICRCTYAEAAVELSTTPEVVGDRVSKARQAIRYEVLAVTSRDWWG